MIVLFVGAGDEIATAFQGLVDHNDLQSINTHRTKISSGRLENRLDLLGVHRADFSRSDHGQQLGFIQHVVAANEYCNGTFYLFPVLLVPAADQGQGLDLLCGRDSKIFCDILDGFHAGCMHQLRRAIAGCLKISNWLQLRSRLLQVRRIAAFRAACHHIFAGIGVDHELVRLRPAHGARMRFHRHKLQPTALKDGSVGVVVLAIRNVEPIGVDIKRVCVLHDELAHAQQSRFGTWLVAELCLNLIPDLRKLLIAAHLLACDFGHDFLVCHAQAQIAPTPVLEAKHVIAHYGPASAHLP